MYLAEAEDYDKHLPIVQKVTDSFEIINPNSNLSPLSSAANPLNAPPSVSTIANEEDEEEEDEEAKEDEDDDDDDNGGGGDDDDDVVCKDQEAILELLVVEEVLSAH